MESRHFSSMTGSRLSNRVTRRRTNVCMVSMASLYFCSTIMSRRMHVRRDHNDDIEQIQRVEYISRCLGLQNGKVRLGIEALLHCQTHVYYNSATEYSTPLLLFLPNWNTIQPQHVNYILNFEKLTTLNSLAPLRHIFKLATFKTLKTLQSFKTFPPKTSFHRIASSAKI